MALSILNTISSQTLHKKNNLFLINTEKSSLGKKIFILSHFQKYDNSQFKTYCMLDSGSDISLINLTTLQSFLTPKQIDNLKQHCEFSVQSFTQNAINIVFNIPLKLKFHKNQTTPSIVQFSVFKSNNTYLTLLGQDFMQQSKLELKYLFPTKPSAIINIPEKIVLKLLFTHPENLHTCTAHVSMKPQESKTVVFQPHTLSCINSKASFLISQSSNPLIHILPTVYTPYSLNKHVLLACVINYSNKIFSGKISAHYEEIHDDQIIKDPESILKNTNTTNNCLFETFSSSDAITTNNVINITLLNNIPETSQNIYPLNTFYLHTPPLKTSTSIDQQKTEINKELLETSFPLTDDPDDPDDSNNHVSLLPQGYSVTEPGNVPLEDLINLSQFEEIKRPYIKDIFLDNYPEIVSRHQFDIGDLSSTLGTYKITLKDGETLPSFKKIFYIGQIERQHMSTILQFLIKTNIVRKTTQNSTPSHFASPAYLVSKADKNATYRLIIDYRLLNQAVNVPVPIIPDITLLLHSLQNKFMFTTIDLSQAFYSISLEKSCQYLTRFATPLGTFEFTKLPMGLSCSPAVFSDLALKMLHYKVEFNEDHEPNLIYDPIPDVHIFFDDLLISSGIKDNYRSTIDYHFSLVKKVIQRLHLHKAKIGFSKSKFCTPQIKYLGWIIHNNRLIPDPKRVQKLTQSPFPPTLKGMRSFLGLINTLRIISPPFLFPDIKLLSSLTSSKVKYAPTNAHRQAFENLKIKLTEAPLFSKIIDPLKPKVLFTDASSNNKAAFSAVLGQLTSPVSSNPTVPDYLNLDDPTHRIIFDLKLPIEPLPLYTPDSTANSKMNLLLFDYLDTDFLGYTVDNINNSLFISIQSIQHAYKCSLSEVQTLRQLLVQNLKKSLYIKQQILSNDFNNELPKFKEFTDKLLTTFPPYDSHLLLLKVLAIALHRTFLVISSLPVHAASPILKFNASTSKPPFVFSLYQKQDNLIFRPLKLNTKFNISDIKQFEICYFYSKTISSQQANYSILELETLALLFSLQALHKLIAGSPLLVLTDSKSLFLLFSNPVRNSASKIARWADKIQFDYPNLTLKFIPTHLNIADFLSRDFVINKDDIKRLPLKNYSVPELDEHLDHSQTFTLQSWRDFVQKNEHLIKLLTPDKTPAITYSITKIATDIDKIIKPINVLQDRLSFQNISTAQKDEFLPIISKCLNTENLTYTNDKKTYTYKNGLLYILIKETPKIFLPEKLEGLLLAFYHLSYGHAGAAKLQIMTSNYYFPNKFDKIRHLTSRCYCCFLNNYPTHKNNAGFYPIPLYFGHTLFCDLAENLNQSKTFSHLLIFVCAMSGFLFVYPLKAKTSSGPLYHILFHLYQLLNIKYLITDNGALFSEKTFLSTLTSLNIQKIQIASLSPQSNGLAEANVKIAKTLLKRTLSNFPTYDWYSLLPVVIKQYNCSVNMITKYSPLAFLHGTSSPHAIPSFGDILPDKLSPLLQNHRSDIQRRMTENANIVKFAKQLLHEHKTKIQTKLNKNRHNAEFSVGDIVFAKDLKIIVGAARPLKSYFSPDPYVVLKVNPTSLLLKRLADGFQTIYNKNIIKKYNKLDATFSHLPPETTEVLVHKFDELENRHFDKLRNVAELNLPNSEILDDTVLLHDEFDAEILAPNSNKNIAINTQPSANDIVDNDITFPMDNSAHNNIPPSIKNIENNFNSKSDLPEMHEKNYLNSHVQDEIDIPISIDKIETNSKSKSDLHVLHEKNYLNPQVQDEIDLKTLPPTNSKTISGDIQGTSRKIKDHKLPNLQVNNPPSSDSDESPIEFKQVRFEP